MHKHKMHKHKVRLTYTKWNTTPHIFDSVCFKISRFKRPVVQIRPTTST